MSEGTDMESEIPVVKVHKYACIYWDEENTYSSVKAEKIACSLVEFPTQESMIGKKFPVVWESTGDEYQGTVKSFGQKGQMNKLALDLAAEAREQSLLIIEEQIQQGRTRNDRHNLVNSQCVKRKNTDGLSIVCSTNAASSSKSAKKSEVNSAAMKVVLALQNEEDNSVDVMETEKDRVILELKKQLQKEKNRVYKLKRASLNLVDDEEKIELGDNVTAPKSIVLNIRDRYRHSPSQFLRSLMEDTGLFTLEQIADCSVKGRSSPMSRGVIRPGLSPLYYTLKRYTIKECGLVPGTVEMLTFEKSTNSICCDARKRLKSKNRVLDFSQNAE